MVQSKLYIWSLVLLLPIFGYGQNKEALAIRALEKGDSLIALDSYSSAYHEFSKALPYFQEIQDWHRQAYIYLWMGESAYVEGNYSQALALTLESKQAAETGLKVDTLSFYSLILQNLGVFYSALGDFENQLKHYELAFQQALRFHGRKSEQAADAYFSLGVAYGRRGDWNRCIAYTDTSLQISKVINYKGGIASAYLNLAHGFAVKEDFVSAIDYQTQAINLSENKAEIARGYNNLGMYYNDLGEFELALSQLQQALTMRRSIYPESHDNVLSTLLNFARVHYDAGNLEESESYIDQAIISGLRAEKENQAYLKIAYNYKAIGLFRQGKLAEALTYYDKARAVEGRQLDVDANVALVGASIYLGMEDYDNALKEIQGALASKIKGFEPQNYYDNPAIHQIEDIGMSMDLLEKKAEILFGKAKKQNSTRDLEVALVVYQMLDALVLQSRSTYLNSRSKELMSANANTNYAGAIQVLHLLYERTNDPAYFDLALAYSEKNKSLSLAEKLNDLYAKSFANIPTRIVQEERKLLQEIEFYSNQVLNYRSSGKDSLIQNWQKLAFEKKEKRANLLATIKREYPEYYDLRYNFEMPSSREIQNNLLEAEEVFLEYFIAKEEIILFVIEPNGKHFLKVPLKGEIKEIIENFRAALIEQEDRFYDLSHQLYQLLLASVEPYIESKKLLIIPDGILGYVPFEALLTKEVNANQYEDHRSLPYLIKKHPIRYYFSAHSAILNLKRQKLKPSGQLLAMAPVFSENATLASVNNLNPDRRGLFENLSPLKGTKEELDRLEHHFSGKFMQDVEASEANFKKLSPKFNLLHIATHTLIDDRFPGLSKMVFSPKSMSEKEDGFLHAYELYNMQLNADLVTLSSCNTGYGRLKKGEGISSMASAFAYAGCPNMVMSLWQVKDQTTPEIMDRFYHNLDRNLPKDQALQIAKIDYIDNYKGLYSHPYYWASFIYLGESSKIEKPTFSFNWKLGLLLISSFLLFGYLFFRRVK